MYMVKWVTSLPLVRLKYSGGLTMFECICSAVEFLCLFLKERVKINLDLNASVSIMTCRTII